MATTMKMPVDKIEEKQVMEWIARNELKTNSSWTEAGPAMFEGAHKVFTEPIFKETLLKADGTAVVESKIAQQLRVDKFKEDRSEWRKDKKQYETECKEICRWLLDCMSPKVETEVKGSYAKKFKDATGKHDHVAMFAIIKEAAEGKAPSASKELKKKLRDLKQTGACAEFATWRYLWQSYQEALMATLGDEFVYSHDELVLNIEANINTEDFGDALKNFRKEGKPKDLELLLKMIDDEYEAAKEKIKAKQDERAAATKGLREHEVVKANKEKGAVKTRQSKTGDRKTGGGAEAGVRQARHRGAAREVHDPDVRDP